MQWLSKLEILARRQFSFESDLLVIVMVIVPILLFLSLTSQPASGEHIKVVCTWHTADTPLTPDTRVSLYIFATNAPSYATDLFWSPYAETLKCFQGMSLLGRNSLVECVKQVPSKLDCWKRVRTKKHFV